MSPRLNRVWLLVPSLFFAAQAWSLGLGDIRLSSALNEPLRAEIQLLAATPEELNNLTVQLASQETFQRYDLERPLFLSGLRFEMVRSGRADGNFIRVTSTAPISEPFVTFLVEAAWSRGRLLREYTILLDPPTFAPPPSAQITEEVTAPVRVAPADSGEIERAPQRQAPPPPAVQPARQVPQQERAPSQPRDEAPSDVPAAARPVAEPVDEFADEPVSESYTGGDLLVVRGDTLWAITQRVRTDSRQSINQTMLAIFAANPDAFEGNINRLRAGASLRIPSSDDIFRINRADAFAEVLRQETEWRGQPILPRVETQPSLTLVPPDEQDEIMPTDAGVEATASDAIEDVEPEVVTDQVEERIREIEAVLQDQNALIEIPDNELAALRQELADLRGEELPFEEVAAADIADEAIAEEDALATEQDAADAETASDTAAAAPRVVARQPADAGIVDTLLGYLNNFWIWIGAALLLTVGILVWFMRRAARRDDEDATGVWNALDADEAGYDEPLDSTERLRALARDDSTIVVEESERAGATGTYSAFDDDDAEDLDFAGTLELPPSAAVADRKATTGMHKTLEDTFSSDTAINLDQTDPVAEADFHMAYGLYDQAADLINGALEADPDRQDLLGKLCEIYFVWGNRDAFIDAAQRLKAQVGSGADPEWDKIVIMGQQIAGDHEMFSGVSAGGATRAVDLSFDGGMEDAGALDMDFADEPDSEGEALGFGGNDDSQIIDLGGAEDGDEAIDFSAFSDDEGESDVIDLSAEDEEDEAGADDEVVDLGRSSIGRLPAREDVLGDETGQVLIAKDTSRGIDFSIDDDVPEIQVRENRHSSSYDQSPTVQSTADGETVEMTPDDEPAAASQTTQTLSIEQQFEMEATGELPAMTPRPATPATDATAEIDLDDLGLDLDELDATGGASDNDFADADFADEDFADEDIAEEDVVDADFAEEEFVADTDDTATSRTLGADDDSRTATGTHSLLDADDGSRTATGRHSLLDADDSLAVTGRNAAVAIEDDPETTSTRQVLDIEEALADSELPDLDDESTALNRALSDDDATQLASLEDFGFDDTDVGIDSSLLDATGQTQVLTDDLSVTAAARLSSSLDETDAATLASDDSDDELSGDAATMLAPLDDEADADDFDFAKTEALPKDIFSSDMSDEGTSRMRHLDGGTDLDLDLDDLTAALKVSEVGDTVNQRRDDATVEQPRLRRGDDSDTSWTGVTQALDPDDLSDELNEARTMTEVGTKLDLARAYVDMGDPAGARSILEEVLDEGDAGQKQQAKQLLSSLPA